MAGKRSRREISEIIHRVPAGLDAAHVGYNFINVLGGVHYAASKRRANVRAELNKSFMTLFFSKGEGPPQRAALMFPVVGYFNALSILAQTSATLRLGDSVPGNVAQPPFSTNVSCFHESIALSSTKVALASAAC